MCSFRVQRWNRSKIIDTQMDLKCLGIFLASCTGYLASFTNSQKSEPPPKTKIIMFVSVIMNLPNNFPVNSYFVSCILSTHPPIQSAKLFERLVGNIRWSFIQMAFHCHSFLIGHFRPSHIFHIFTSQSTVQARHHHLKPI